MERSVDEKSLFHYIQKRYQPEIFGLQEFYLIGLQDYASPYYDLMWNFTDKPFLFVILSQA